MSSAPVTIHCFREMNFADRTAIGYKCQWIQNQIHNNPITTPF